MIRDKLVPKLVREIGFKQEQFVFIPIAALGGGNINEKVQEMPWYTGATLFEALDKVPLPARNEADAFRMPVIDRFVTTQLYASGKIEKGIISEGSLVMIMPSGAKGIVGGIFADDARIRTAGPGDNVNMTLKGVTTTDCKTGSVVCLDGNPCSVAERVVVKLRLTPDAPNFMTAGFTAVCHIHTEIVQVMFDKLLETFEPTKEKNPMCIKANQTVRCILKFERPICVEPFAAFPQLGRFIIRHEATTIAVGVVEKLPKSAAAAKK
jgi:translation elongation factor EF-1alpha